MRHRLDWWAIINDLQAAGMTNQRIARVCERSPKWVDELKNRQVEPRWCDGEALIGLWVRVCSRHRDELPPRRGDAGGNLPRGRNKMATC